MTDPSCSSKSQDDFATGYFLTHEVMQWFWKQLNESQENFSDPCFNLLQEHSYPLPKTLLITAGFDPLSDEGEEYARKIFESGNACRSHTLSPSNSWFCYHDSPQELQKKLLWI